MRSSKPQSDKIDLVEALGSGHRNIVQTYDVFLNHSSKDKPAVIKLAERLRSDGSCERLSSLLKDSAGQE